MDNSFHFFLFVFFAKLPLHNSGKVPHIINNNLSSDFFYIADLIVHRGLLTDTRSAAPKDIFINPSPPRETSKKKYLDRIIFLKQHLHAIHLCHVMSLHKHPFCYFSECVQVGVF